MIINSNYSGRNLWGAMKSIHFLHIHIQSNLNYRSGNDKLKCGINSVNIMN
jgi:hypothetical protein